MNRVEIAKKLRHVWREYGTLNNVVIAAALVIAASWAWGTISTMQTNFAAQKAYDDQKRQLELTQLEVDTLKYQQNYYKSDEYKDLMARTNLGLASPGEKVLLLPPNTTAAKADGAVSTKPAAVTSQTTTMSNFEQWLHFLTGANAHDLHN